MTKSSVAEEVDGRGSEDGECGKDAGGKGDRWQGVSGCWRVAGGRKRVSKWPRGQVANDDD